MPDPSEQLDHRPHWRPDRRTTKSLALVGSVLLLLGTGMGWQVWQKRGNIAIGQPQQPQGVPVKLETLAPATVTISSDFVGSLEAEQVVEIRPEITGRVRRLFVKAGDRVVRGQQIAQLQPDQEQANLDGVVASVTAAQANRASFQANVNSAQANQASVRANVNSAFASRYTARYQLNSLRDELLARYADAELAYKDHARIEFLTEEGVLSAQELDRAKREMEVANANLRSLRQQVSAAEATLYEAEANYESAQANFAQASAGVDQAQAELDEAQAGFEQAEAERDRAQAQLQDTIIKAPFTGVIGDLPTRVGDVVSDSDTLTTLTQNNRLNLRISVPTARAVELKVGQFVELVTEKGNILNTGTISFVDANIEPSRQTVLAKATFQNAGTILRNGQFVRARLVWRTEPGLLIPPTAITRLAGKPFVFVAAPPGPEDEAPPGVELIAQQRPVELGKLQNNRYQVVSGLQAGEQIVTSGTQNLTNGAPLMVLPPETPESDFIAP